LIELIKYVVANGDLQQQGNDVARSSTPIERKRMDRPVRIVNDETINDEQSTGDDVIQ
jgi:hypothetical protein